MGNLINDGIGDQIISDLLGLRNDSEVISDPLTGSGSGSGSGRGSREKGTEPLQIRDILVHGLGDLLLGHGENDMIHGVVVHVDLEGDLVPARNDHVVDPGDEIVPALQLQSGKQPLAVPSPARVVLERRLAFLQQQWRFLLVYTVADPQEAEILLEDRILRRELRRPRQRDVLVLALPGEVIDCEHDKKASADDLHGEGARRVGGWRGLSGGGVFGGFGIGGRLGGGVFHGDAFEFIVVPKIEGREFGEIRRWRLGSGSRVGEGG